MARMRGYMPWGSPTMTTMYQKTIRVTPPLPEEKYPERQAPQSATVEDGAGGASICRVLLRSPSPPDISYTLFRRCAARPLLAAHFHHTKLVAI